MDLRGSWYRFRIKPEIVSEHPVAGLDVAGRQKEVQTSILGICDIKWDKHIDFVGGIRGLEVLERRVREDCKVAFAMYPTSIQELFQMSDVRSSLFIQIEGQGS